MKEIPSTEHIAEWTGLVDVQISTDGLRDFTTANPHVTEIFLDGETQEMTELRSAIPSVVVNHISNEDLQKMHDKTPIIPKWILAEKNFDSIMAQRWEDIRPVTAEFVPTLNCDYRCAQCSYGEPKKNLDLWMKEDGRGFSTNFSDEFHMSEETMQLTIDRLVEGGVKNILFTGGGEPFANPRITLDGMRYAKEKGMTIGLYSNGSLLTDKMIDEIMEISPLFFRISVYGSNPEAFADYTNQAPKTFDRVLQNIKKLARRKIETGSQTQLGLSYLLHPKTIPGITNFPEALSSVLTDEEFAAISFCRFTPAVDYFGGEQHSQSLMTQTFAEIEEQVKPKLEEKGIEAKLYHHRLNDLNSSKTYSQCRASGWYLEVGPSGDAYLCCEKLFVPEFKIGNLTQQTVEEVYTSELRRQVLGRVNQQDCSECPTLCKPHELNKIFDEVGGLIDEGKGDLVRRWREELLVIGENKSHFAGRLNDFES